MSIILIGISELIETKYLLVEVEEAAGKGNFKSYKLYPSFFVYLIYVNSKSFLHLKRFQHFSDVRKDDCHGLKPKVCDEKKRIEKLKEKYGKLDPAWDQISKLIESIDSDEVLDVMNLRPKHDDWMAKQDDCDGFRC